MAEVFVTVRDVSNRKEQIAAWLVAGDAVFVTDGGEVLFQVTATDRKTPPPCIKPRVFGRRTGRAIMSDDFNDPLPAEYWSGGLP